MNKRALTSLIKTQALSLGFARCGIAKAGFLDEEAPRLLRWLSSGKSADMAYMAERVEIRLDPRKLLEGARSIICLAHSYYTDRKLNDPTAPKISKYARGGDYHRVLKGKAGRLAESLREHIGDFKYLITVDTNYIQEKAWAVRAGVGWQGKNGLIMHRDTGSFLFLTLLIVDFDLDYDQPIPDSCANCRICIDACPTAAIVEPRVVDATRCISYMTIEYKGELPNEMKGRFANWAYGCDTCQDVCPFNAKAPVHREPQFDAADELYQLTADEWRRFNQEIFNRLFKGTPLARGGFRRLKRNLDFLFS
jgi:epoxyqueuosine reductase